MKGAWGAECECEENGGSWRARRGGAERVGACVELVVRSDMDAAGREVVDVGGRCVWWRECRTAARCAGERCGTVVVS